MKIGQNQKKNNHLGWIYTENLNMKLEMMKHHLSICQMVVQEIIEEEVRTLAGERYNRDKPNGGRYSRWGTNPGSVWIGKEKVPLEVPRVYDSEAGAHRSLESYQQLREVDAPAEKMVKGILAGLSMGRYQEVVQDLTESFGLSRSSVSKKFIEESEKQVKEFHNRDLTGKSIIALFVDGKYLAKEQVVIVLGITAQGEKIPLDFIQTTTENATSIKQVFQTMIRRGLRYERGLLCIVDGSKGIEKALEMVFGKCAVVQRCQWHKRENIVSYLPEELQPEFRRKITQAYSENTYEAARSKLLKIRKELELINISAARSLDEGFEQTLTLHQLGLVPMFSTSFSTTNCIENLNLSIERYLKNVKNWKNSNQRHRWVTVALMDVEPRFRKVNNYKKLSVLVTAVETEVASRKRGKRKVA